MLSVTYWTTHSTGCGYYYFSNALYDHNTAQETGLYSMQDSDTVFYVVLHFLIALRIS